MFVAPRIGCQHFKSRVKEIRAENNTIKSALDDLIDNPYGIANAIRTTSPDFKVRCDIDIMYSDNRIYEICVSDNLPDGFDKIMDTGVNNPINMGHIRSGHEDDNESSEFGTGMKKSIIYLGDRTEIYTRTGSNYVYVKFEIPRMCNEALPENSYEPTAFELVAEQTYKSNHKFDTGSSIRISNLVRSYDCTMTQTEFERDLLAHLSKAYSGLIKRGAIEIRLNGTEVPVEIDLYALVPNECKQWFKFYLTPRGTVFREGLTPTGRPQYMEFNGKDFEKTSDFTSAGLCVEYRSLTTKNTEYAGIMNNNMTDIERMGRCYDPSIRLTKEPSDGYEQHVYNRIIYDSKKLNMYLGVGANKRVVERSNVLMSAIKVTAKETTSKWRKYCKEQIETAKANKPKCDEFFGKGSNKKQQEEEKKQEEEEKQQKEEDKQQKEEEKQEEEEEKQEEEEKEEEEQKEEQTEEEEEDKQQEEEQKKEEKHQEEEKQHEEEEQKEEEQNEKEKNEEEQKEEEEDELMVDAVEVNEVNKANILGLTKSLMELLAADLPDSEFKNKCALITQQIMNQL